MNANLYITIAVILTLALAACTENNADNTVCFATSGEYPPFEYISNNTLTGFEIDLGKAIAEELGKKAAFKNIPFGSVLAALESEAVDAAISTITITNERGKNFDFSLPYYTAGISIIFNNKNPIKNIAGLNGKKIACQLGTTLETWLKKNTTSTEIITNDNNNQAIESLKAGHVDGVLIDSVQGSIFSNKNENLSCIIITQAANSYGIALKKGDSLKNDINKALAALEKKGTVKNLKKKYHLEEEP